MTLIGVFRLQFTSHTHFSLYASAFDHLNVSRIWSLRVCAVQRHYCFGVSMLQERKIAPFRVKSIRPQADNQFIKSSSWTCRYTGTTTTTAYGRFLACTHEVTKRIASTNGIMHYVRRERDLYWNSNCIHIVVKALRALAYVGLFGPLTVVITRIVIDAKSNLYPYQPTYFVRKYAAFLYWRYFFGHGGCLPPPILGRQCDSNLQGALPVW